jgi:hypothetical protein
VVESSVVGVVDAADALFTEETTTCASDTVEEAIVRSSQRLGSQERAEVRLKWQKIMKKLEKFGGKMLLFIDRVILTYRLLP